MGSLFMRGFVSQDTSMTFSDFESMADDSPMLLDLSSMDDSLQYLSLEDICLKGSTKQITSALEALVENKKAWKVILWTPLCSKRLVQNLHILTGVSSVIYDSLNIQVDVFAQENYWTLIQNGLHDSDRLTVKRAHYLLKRSFEFYKKFPSEQCEYFPSTSLPHWPTYILILETLEEPQPHIVKQILGSLQKLTYSNDFHSSWLTPIYKLLFRHPNEGIVFWALQNFLREFKESAKRDCPYILLDSLYQALNSYPFFTQRKMCILESLKGFFTSNSIDLSRLLTSIKWAPLPLFHVLRTLHDSSIIKDSSLISLSFSMLSKYISEEMTYLDPYIRGACQQYLLEIALLSSVPNQNTFVFLHSFKRILFPGTSLWTKVSNWISSSEIAHQFSFSSSLSSILPKLSSFSNSLLIKNAQIYALQILLVKKGRIPDSLGTAITDTLDRPYAPPVVFHLHILSSILRITEIKSRKSHLEYSVSPIPSLTSDSLKIWFHKHEGILSVVKRQILNLRQYEDLELLNSYITLLSVYKNHDDFLLSLPKSSSYEKIIVFRIAGALTLSFPSQENPSLSFNLTKNEIGNRNEQKMYGDLLDDYIGNQWKLLSPTKISDPSIYDLALQTISSGGKESLISVNNYLTTSLDLNPQLNDLVRDYLPMALESVMSYRKNEGFFPCLTSFISLAFHQRLLNSYTEEMSCYAKSLFAKSENIPGIAVLLMNHLLNQSLPISFSNLVTVLSLTYGSVHRAKQRQEIEANQIIFNSTDKSAINYIEGSSHGMESRIRFCGVTLCLRSPDSEIVNGLSDLDTQSTGGKKRHFMNSTTHLLRHRIHQGLLLLGPKVKNPSSIYKYVIQSLYNPDQQLSVRLLAEWNVILIIKHHSDYLSFFEKEYLEVKDTLKPSVLSSFISIAAQVFEVEKALTLLAPLTMIQHYAPRIAAQTHIFKLFKKHGTELSEKWSSLQYAILSAFQTHDTNSKQIDFILNIFDPFIDYNLQSIYCDFSRILFVNDDNICSMIPTSEFPPSFNSQSLLPLHLEERETSVFSREEELEEESKDGQRNNEATSNIFNIQKKIMPWDGMDLKILPQIREKAHPHLILVSSLIDRLPNLGGLMRTCEIFGVGVFVIANSESVHQKEFQAVSVTAHQWVSILEVKPVDLPAYLTSLKEKEGYTIVGVEQTASSVSLYDYSFPLKTLLVLGHEKEGIPLSLLSLLDNCLQIPQYGLIRSFNVHVTGALVLGEYVRQQSLSSST